VTTINSEKYVKSCICAGCLRAKFDSTLMDRVYSCVGIEGLLISGNKMHHLHLQKLIFLTQTEIVFVNILVSRIMRSVTQ